MNAEELKKLKDKMKPFLESARTKENIDMLFLLLTDILSENSYVIYAGAEAENILSQGFNQMPVDGEALLEGVVSRKKQFVPSHQICPKHTVSPSSLPRRVLLYSNCFC